MHLEQRQRAQDWLKQRGFECALFSAPATVTGAIAPDRVKGVTITTWPCEDIWMMPSIIGMSSFSGELVLMMV